MFRVPSGVTGTRLPPAAIGLALAPAFFVLIATLAPVAVKDARLTAKSGIAECAAIEAPQSRLACYDAFAKQKPPMPAKGGEPILPSG
jgi:predicted lipoprotein with Yx(FWY)xxD motif